MALSYAVATRNAVLAAIIGRIDGDAGGGTVKVYTGTRPATADTALSGNTLLLTFTFAASSFGAPSSGSATVAGLPLAAIGAAAGTAAWFRCADESGDTVFDGSCGASGSGADIELSTTTVSVGLAVNLTGGTLTQPAS